MSSTRPKPVSPRMRLRMVVMIAIASLGACEKKGIDAPALQAVKSQPVKLDASVAAMPTIGRWKGDEVCLEIFANSDVELSLHGDEPKVLVMGKATLLPGEAKGFDLQVAGATIWKARYLSSCRKVHETGHWADEIDVLGTRVGKGATTNFTIEMIAADELELCGARCARLRRDAPLLPRHWRRADLTYPDNPELVWQAGDLLELKLAEGSAHLWAGMSENHIAEIAVDVKLRAISQDAFELRVTPGAIGKRHSQDALADPGSVQLLGISPMQHQELTLTLTRLAGQRLQVCGKPQECQILERQFDSYSYGLH